MAVVTDVQPNFVKCRLDSGVNGFLPKMFLSDGDLNECGDVVQLGQILTCKIMKVEKEKFSVKLSARTSDLKQIGAPSFLADKWLQDAQSDEEIEFRRLEEKRKKDSKTIVNKVLTNRNITHANYQRISESKAGRILNQRSIGDVIFRPDKFDRLDRLGISWKFGLGEKDIVNMSIHEQDKDIMNPDLSSSLLLEGEMYESLDEIIGRYSHNYVFCILINMCFVFL